MLFDLRQKNEKARKVVMGQCRATTPNRAMGSILEMDEKDNNGSRYTPQKASEKTNKRCEKVVGIAHKKAFTW